MNRDVDTDQTFEHDPDDPVGRGQVDPLSAIPAPAQAQPESPMGKVGAAVQAGSEIRRGVGSVKQGAMVGGKIGGAYGAVAGGIAGAGRAIVQSRHRNKVLVAILCVGLPNLLVIAMFAFGVTSVGSSFASQVSTQAMSRNRAKGAITGGQAAAYAEASARSGVNWAVLAALESDVSVLGDDGAADSSVPVPNTDPDAELTAHVATWNVDRFVGDTDRVITGVESLGEAGADVIGLQEAVPPIRRMLRDRLGPEWGFTADDAEMMVYRKDRVENVYQHSVELFGARRVEPSDGVSVVGARYLQQAEFKTATGAMFGVINVHLVPGIETGGQPDTTRPKRLALAYEQLEAVAAASDRFVAAGVPTAVTGDHNIAAEGDSRVRFSRFPYSFYAAHGLYSNWRTLGYPSQGTHAGGRLIDYVFATNGLMAPTAQMIMGSWGSDHRSVLVTMSNKRGARSGAAVLTTAGTASTGASSTTASATVGGAGPFHLLVTEYDKAAGARGLDPVTDGQAENRADSGTAIGRLFTRLLADADPVITNSSLTAGAKATETTAGTVYTLSDDPDGVAAQQRTRTAYVRALEQLPLVDAELKASAWYDLALQLALGNPPARCNTVSERPADSISPSASPGLRPSSSTPATATTSPANNGTRDSQPGMTTLTATDTNGTKITLNARQLQHAGEIIGVGTALNLDPKYIKTALMTALQESTLQVYANTNVPESLQYPHETTGHDHDSVNLMQQRPGAWGTVRQLMQIDFSIRMFYGGATKPKKDGPRGLLDIPGYETLPLGQLAQKVQVSAFPDAYDKWAPVADVLLAKVGGITATDQQDGCGGAAAAAAAGGITPGTCKDIDAAVPRKNPLSCDAAIKKAISRTTRSCSWYRMCLAFTADSYGWNGSGISTAYNQYLLLKRKGFIHQPDGLSPPVGALVYWKGSDYAGHIALVVADGKIASNDIRKAGCISIVPWDAPATEWHQRYLGWSLPYYPNGG